MTDAGSRRIALVTGGARGIGAAIAAELAAAGHRVAIADLVVEPSSGAAAGSAGGAAGPAGPAVSSASAAAGLADAALAVHIDVADTASVADAVTTVERALGPIEILVNNAGWDELHPFLETDEPFWDRVIEINFKGCLRTCRRIVPGMVERGYGRVVNISSDAARVGSSLEAVYSGAKGAVLSFTKTLAREVARRGVTVNAVCPGPTETPMLEGIIAAGEDAARTIEAMRRAVPMRRLGKPEDVAAAVAFLASDRAAFITGQTLSVSGGLTMA